MPSESELETAHSNKFAALHHKLRKNLFRLMLGLFLALIVVAGYSAANPLGRLGCLILLSMIAMLIGLAFLQMRCKGTILYFSLSLFVPVIDILRQMVNGRVEEPYLTAAVAAGYVVLISIAIKLIGRYIMNQRMVTIDTVMGSVCIYLLIAFLFFVYYEAVLLLQTNAFSGVSSNHEFELVYFSLNTLTTLGQGDIVPKTHLAQALCCVEACVGQMFPAIVVSKLVSMYVVNELDRQKHEYESTS